MKSEPQSVQPQIPSTQEQVALFGLRYVEKVRVPVKEDEKVMRMSQWMDPRDTGYTLDSIA